MSSLQFDYNEVLGFQTYAKVKKFMDFIMNDEEIKPIVFWESDLLIATELYASQINRLITQRTTTPKTKIFYDQEPVILSRIAFDQDQEHKKSSDMFDLIQTLEKDKPIRGLLESILIRVFLGESLDDIKLENLIGVDCEDYYQIENIDFGNALFRNNMNFLTPEITGEELIGILSEIKHQIKIQNSTYYFDLLNQLVKNPEIEIKETIEKLQNLRDEDFEQIEESILSIKIDDSAVFNTDMIKRITQDVKRRSAMIKEIDFGFTHDETEKNAPTVKTNVTEPVAQRLVENNLGTHLSTKI